MNTNTNKKEQWEVIDNYSNYKVSNRGRVMNTLTGNIVQTSVNSTTGYSQICLKSDDGKWTTQLVHRLVAKTFIPNSNNLEQVDHIDGCRTRNCVSNLRWVSRKFNNSRPRTRKLKSQNGGCTSHSHQIIKGVYKDGTTRYFKNQHQLEKENIMSHVMAMLILNGKFKSAKGWVLTYLPIESDEAKKAIDTGLVKVRSTLREENKAKRKATRKQCKMDRATLKQHIITDMLMDYWSAKARGENPELTMDEIYKKANADIRVVCQYTKKGKLMKEWKNVYEAQSNLDINGIYDAVQGIKPMAGGFIWRYKYN